MVLGERRRGSLPHTAAPRSCTRKRPRPRSTLGTPQACPSGSRASQPCPRAARRSAQGTGRRGRAGNLVGRPVGLQQPRTVSCCGTASRAGHLLVEVVIGPAGWCGSALTRRVPLRGGRNARPVSPGPSGPTRCQGGVPQPPVGRLVVPAAGPLVAPVVGGLPRPWSCRAQLPVRYDRTSLKGYRRPRPCRHVPFGSI
jgi:hypothetical protein